VKTKRVLAMSFEEWKEYKVGDLYDVFSGLSKPREQFGFDYPFVTFKDVSQNYFLPEELTSLASTTSKEIASCSVNKGDIFLTRTSETQNELGMSSVALKDYDNFDDDVIQVHPVKIFAVFWKTGNIQGNIN
jgi:type I restriction enzyme S subunit